MRPTNKNGLDTPAKKSVQTVISNPTSREGITVMHATPSISENRDTVTSDDDGTHTPVAAPQD